jgi:hypothetical protein
MTQQPKKQKGSQTTQNHAPKISQFKDQSGKLNFKHEREINFEKNLIKSE